MYSYGVLLLQMFTGRRPTDEEFEDGLDLHQFCKIALHKGVMKIIDPHVLEHEEEANDDHRDIHVLELYCKFGLIDDARRLFDGMSERNVFSWTSIMGLYCGLGDYEETIRLFYCMVDRGVRPDHFVFPKVFKACSVFSELSVRDVVIWNSIISACAHNEQGVTALNLLREMVKSKVQPNMVTIVSILPACARLAALQQGKEIHQFIIRNGLDAFNLVIDLYGRCGLVKIARRIFDLMPQRDIVSWNTMIAGYGMHGFGMDAVNLFRRLQCTDLKPNHFTFTSLLSACSHAGLTDEGWKYFKMMKSEYDLDPAIEQYACLVDLLARAGQFEESMEFIKEMPFQPNAVIWGSILGACRIHLNPELAEQAASFLFELEPQNSGNYILLANIYSAVGRWEEAAKVRCLMKERGVSKPPGCSWIAVKRRIHSFIVGDASHPLIEEISCKVESLYSEIKEIGYVPETNFVLQDVEDDEKENSLCGHSEKLAIAFGLISTPSGTPLRIIKNLRVCGDCHSATKFISKVTNREIIMRDCFRFHHFVDGVCSCGDYW
ncbi:hypothetical protein Syun_031444 [Stephania yunnanensis]|uniref:DYW domain-containing protein n=1 Tax=Stephania yunnanensis TaxID=152371 RepID=A0AAP0DVU1_9MAGN